MIEITKEEYKQLVLDQDRLLRLFGYLVEKAQDSAKSDAENNLTMRDNVLIQLDVVDLITGFSLADIYESTYKSN